MRVGVAVLAIVVAAIPTVSISEPNDSDGQEAANRQEFSAGVAAMLAGHYESAIGIFRVLAARTGAPRVRLELARSLFLAERYRESKREFNQVYYSPNLPYQVRRSINLYLEQIDRRIGYLVPSIGISVDTNPTRATSATDFSLFGLPVVLQQPKRGQAIGLQYGLSGRTPLNGRGTLSLVSAVSGVQYRHSPNSYVEAGAGLSLDDLTGTRSLETGVRLYRRENSDTLVSPYISGVYRLSQTKISQANVTLSLSYSDFRYNAYLSGPVAQAAVQRGIEIAKSATLITSVHGSVTRTRDARYNQVEGGLAASLYRSLPAIAADVVLTGQLARRWFSGVDPLFGALRRDTDWSCGVRVIGTTPFKRLFPSLGVQYERRDSSLPFYSYEQTGFTADLLYRF